MTLRLRPEIQRQVDEGIRILREGGIIAYPTDTVYGLGASMSKLAAVARVFRVKKRPLDMALPLLVATISQVEELADRVTPIARQLIKRFLPGALTLVLPASPAVPATVTAGGSTVAVRIPDHPVPLALIAGTGAPLVGTSANVSGQPSPLTAAAVRSQLAGEVDLVIDEDGCCKGTESTIIDLTGEVPVVLREGSISLQVLQQVCGTDLVNKAG